MDDIYNQFVTKTKAEKFGQFMNYLNNTSPNPKQNSDSVKPYILLLPHSQGNLYANQLVSFLIKAQGYLVEHTAIFGIATPTSKIEGLKFGDFTV